MPAAIPREPASGLSRTWLSVRLLVLATLVLLSAMVALVWRQGALLAETREMRAAHTSAAAISAEIENRIDISTELARFYVRTGDLLYLRYYENEMAIHEGRAPVPAGYSRHYWHRVMAGELVLPPLGTSASFQVRVERAGLGDPERQALEQALHAWSAVQALERAVMAKRLGSPRGSPDQAKSVLFGTDYLVARAAVFRPIGAFREALEARFASRFERIARTQRLLRGALLSTGIASASLLLVLLVLLWTRLFRPLRALQAWLEGGASGATPRALHGFSCMADSMALFASDSRELREDREQLLLALRQADERFTRLASQVEEMAFHCRLDPVSNLPRFSYASPRSQQVLGMEPQRLLAEPDWLEKSLNPDDLRTLKDAVRTAIATGGRLDLVLRLAPCAGANSGGLVRLLAESADGSHVRHAYAGVVTRLQDGEPAGA